MYLPDQNADAQRALSICKSFRDLGYNVVMIGIDLQQKSGTPILETKRDIFGFTAFTVSKPKKIKELIHYSTSIREIKEVINFYQPENIFAVIALEHDAIALMRLISFCKKKEVLFIADAEEWYEKSNLRFPLNIAKDLDTWLRMRYIYPKKVKNMICISRFFERHYEKNIAHRVVVPGTIDKNDEKWLKLVQYKPNEIFTLGYAGTPGLKMEKERLDWLLIALKELNEEGYNCGLKIAGVDEVTVNNILQDDSTKYNIEAMGRIPHNDCLNLIASSDFSVIVREDKRVTRAGFPTKLSESFGCGTPVITTRTSNIADFIIKGKTGFLCDNCSKESLKKTIIEAMKLSKESLVNIHSELKNSCLLQYQEYNQKIYEFLEDIKGESL